MTLCHILPERRGWVNMVKDWGLEVSKFDIQFRYYVHFRTDTFGKTA